MKKNSTLSKMTAKAIFAAALLATQSLTAQYIPKGVVAGTTASALYQDASGNIGLGTTAPGARLHVAGDLNLTGRLKIGGANALYISAQNMIAGNSAISATLGNGNAFFGYSNAGGSSASFNTIMGIYAGWANTTGSVNTYIGNYAGGQNRTGKSNTYVGAASGANGTKGSYNTCIGESAGGYNEGFNNTLVGSSAGVYGTSFRGSSFFGANAGVNTTGSFNTYIGNASAGLNTTGYNNTFLGDSAGYNNTTGYNNTFLGRNAGVTSSFSGLSNATAIGAGAQVSASNTLILGGSKTYVGINLTSSAYNLEVNGGAGKPGSGTWTVTSDARLKTNVSDFSDGLATLLKIHPVWFTYNGKTGLPTDKKYVGIIAQEMKEVAPYTVGTTARQEADGQMTDYLDYDPNALFYISVNAIKEQQAQIAEMKAAHAAEMTALKAELQSLREALGGGRALKPGDVLNNPAVTLSQNQPNPFREGTTIRFFVPENARSARLVVQSADGRFSQSYSLSTRGQGSFRLQGAELPAGNLLYFIEADGKVSDAKTMLLLK